MEIPYQESLRDKLHKFLNYNCYSLYLNTIPIFINHMLIAGYIYIKLGDSTSRCMKGFRWVCKICSLNVNISNGNRVNTKINKILSHLNLNEIKWKMFDLHSDYANLTDMMQFYDILFLKICVRTSQKEYDSVISDITETVKNPTERHFVLVKTFYLFHPFFMCSLCGKIFTENPTEDDSSILHIIQHVNEVANTNSISCKR